jgi:hypothetical protein
MEVVRRTRLADRLVVGAAIGLAGAIAADALHHRRDAAAPRAPVVRRAAEPVAAPVPASIRLVPSSTAFLRRCAALRTTLSLAPGPRLVLRYDGPPCHLPPLHLHARERSSGGALSYEGPALTGEPLAGNYARDSVVEAPLSAPAAVCGASATISGGGLRATGRVRCR